MPDPRYLMMKNRMNGGGRSPGNRPKSLHSRRRREAFRFGVDEAVDEEGLAKSGEEDTSCFVGCEAVPIRELVIERPSVSRQRRYIGCSLKESLRYFPPHHINVGEPLDKNPRGLWDDFGSVLVVQGASELQAKAADGPCDEGAINSQHLARERFVFDRRYLQLVEYLRKSRVEATDQAIKFTDRGFSCWVGVNTSKDGDDLLVVASGPIAPTARWEGIAFRPFSPVEQRPRGDVIFFDRRRITAAEATSWMLQEKGAMPLSFAAHSRRLTYWRSVPGGSERRVQWQIVS